MRIHCTTTFLDGRDRYEKGDVRTVDDESAQRFISNAWATPVGDEAPPAADTTTDTALHVKGATHKQRATNG